MTKVAVLYICTGKYIAFWQEFYESAEQYLLPGCEVHYFVFTDAPSLYGEEDNPRIHRCPQKAYSWPFSTLLRFEIFLSREEELKAFDYIFFFNANAQFTTTITPEMFLPRADRGEHLLVVQHPAFYNKPNYEYTYDRNPRCRAFIPMGLGKYYVCGGINGGETAAFLKLCHTLDRRIHKDLAHHVIALWHDESQINRYILWRKDFRILSPSYCWPEGWNLPQPCRILLRSKQRYFDVQQLRKDAPATVLPPYVVRCNAFMKRAARWLQRRLPPQKKEVNDE